MHINLSVSCFRLSSGRSTKYLIISIVILIVVIAGVGGGVVGAIRNHRQDPGRNLLRSSLLKSVSLSGFFRSAAEYTGFYSDFCFGFSDIYFGPSDIFFGPSDIFKLDVTSF